MQGGSINLRKPATVTPTTHEHSSSTPQEIVEVSSTSKAEIEDYFG